MLQDLQVTYFCDSSMFGKKVTKHIPPNGGEKNVKNGDLPW